MFPSHVGNAYAPPPKFYRFKEDSLTSSGFSILHIDAGSFSKPANTLIKCISRAIGGLYEPTQIVRRANAEREAKLIELEGDIAVSELKQRTIRRLLAQEGKYQENFEKIIRAALPLLNDGAKPEQIPNDWYTHLFEKARIISDEQMQSLWSRILAEEANNPGRFSRRTVSFVDALDKSEAELFTKLCGFNIRIDNLIPLVFNEQDEIYQRNGIDFVGLNLLDSIGLINFESLTGIEASIQQGNMFFSYYGRSYVLEVGEKDSGKIKVGRAMLTRVGQELAPICGSMPVPGFEKYMLDKWQQYSPRRFNLSEIIR